jgi:radical SAM superfamily enzyme YgiQ (UPF0313 family)
MFAYKKSKFRMDIVYPNKMYGGVYSLGPLIVYNLMNNRKDWSCERVFLDEGKITSELVGFSLQYELDLINVLKMKPKNRIVFAGGPLVELFHKSLIKYFDFLILGDVEVVLPKVIDEYEKGIGGFLERIKKIEGVFINGKGQSRYAKSIEEFEYPIVQPFPQRIGKEFVFGKCFMLEIERGCPFKCNFCALPEFYEGKVRFRSLEKIKEIIDEGLKENKVERVVIYSPSFMHPQRKEILEYLISKNVRVSIPSLRAEKVDLETLKLIRKAGQESITIAPECNFRIRNLLGKHVSDEEYFEFAKNAKEAGFKKLKMYLMIGIKGMGEKDIEETIAFVKKFKEEFSGEVKISLNYFIPKLGTKMYSELEEKKKLLSELKLMKKGLSYFEMKIPSISSAFREWNFMKKSL